MSTSEIITLVWGIVNSAPGITVLVSLLLLGMNYLWAKKPEWKVVYEKYQGTLVSAVKEAEKMSNASGKEKLAKALGLVGEVLVGVDKASVTEALSIVHDELEEKGSIPNGFNTPTVAAPELE